jgi:NADH dehydrogenase
MKVIEGWMSAPKLTGFFGGAQAWYNSILNPGGGATDGTGGATPGAAAETLSQAAQSAAQVWRWSNTISNLSYGLFQAIFVSGKTRNSTLSDWPNSTYRAELVYSNPDLR